MEGEDMEVKQGVKEAAKTFSPEFVKQYDAIMKEFVKTGSLPKEALGFPPEKIESLYAHAYQLYNTGKYIDADHIFRMLVILDPKEYKYYLGLAACLHMLKEFENAAKVYTVAGIMDPQNPIPHFHASDCYIQLRDRASAIIMLELALKRAGDKPEYRVLKERALLTIENLKKELNEQFNPKK